MHPRQSSRTFRAAAACAALAALGLLHAADGPAARVNTAVIPQLNPGFMDRHNEFVEIAKKGDIDVLFLGDSITDWWRHPGRGYTPPPVDYTPRRGGAGRIGGAAGNAPGRGRGAAPGRGNVPPDAADAVQTVAAVAATPPPATPPTANVPPAAANVSPPVGNTPATPVNAVADVVADVVADAAIPPGRGGDTVPVGSNIVVTNTSPAPVAMTPPPGTPPAGPDTPFAGKPVFEKYFGHLKVANFGIAGDTTQGVLWRLQNGEGTGYQPKAIMLMIGTNNAGRNTAPEIAEGVAVVVQELRKDFPAARILLLGIFPRSTPDNPVRAKLADVNARIAKLHDNKHVFYLDIGPKFLERDGTISKGVMSDALHPTMRGYQIWAEAVKEPLAKLLN